MPTITPMKTNVTHGTQLHGDVETVIDFSYLKDRINTGGRCEAAVIYRTRLKWAKFRRCPKNSLKSPLITKGIVYKSYVKSAKLYGSEAW